MTLRELALFRSELEDALATNEPVLPLLLRACMEKITITIEPYQQDPYLLVVRMSQVENNETFGAQLLLDPETMLATTFYPQPEPEIKSKPEDVLARIVSGNLGPLSIGFNTDAYDGRTIIQPGAFKDQTDIPVLWGDKGPVIGTAEIKADGTAIFKLNSHPDAEDG